MKKILSFKNSIGLSQNEMAMLLGITESQWSMYKSGKRDIPLAAKQELAAVVTHRQNAKTVLSKETIKIMATEKKQEKDWLKREHLIAQHKQELLERKISALEKSRAECFAALEVVHYLESQPEKEHLVALAKSIKIRAINTLNKNSLHRLGQLQLKKEGLQMLKNTITEKAMKIENEL